MRVDDVPLWLTPAFHAFGYGAGSLLQALFATLRRACDLERPARPYLGPRVECIWHEHLPAYMASYLPGRAGLRYAWMNHPAWYMRPVHVALAWNGVDHLALGSTGHGGQAALDQVVAWLGQGFSTGLAVDGPAGPARVLKRGALDMALRSGLPILPIRFEYERALRVGGWDRKWFPLPGSRVRIIEGAPLSVTSESYAQRRRELSVALSV